MYKIVLFVRQEEFRHTFLKSKTFIFEVKMVTQKDVADLAGVSFITVSRVVRGEANVKPETKRKVEDAIAQLGYAPSFAGQVLNSGRCNTIGVLTPIPLYISGRSFYLMNLLSGINEVCHKNKTDILMWICFFYFFP